ncbi:hypothetical protein [Methylobacterium trifolii]|uniref:Uncharacterized protein n=1 Tax=Methylobacterium trifolii TaxID=1003092 RepID=A0ABQ4U520_9HYPH|nr:hypothetical protein [Methylobacterium trifolii]GJE61932.1 hypothetical protein MPOCJGCO_4060 [Methylobacterium trifolii]
MPIAAVVAMVVGHSEMRHDTLPTMAGAQALYRRFRLTPKPPYYETPVTGTLFLRRPLAPPAAQAGPSTG